MIIFKHFEMDQISRFNYQQGVGTNKLKNIMLN